VFSSDLATSYQMQRTTLAFSYGFLQSGLSTKVSYLAQLTTHTGLMANITWESSFPRNQLGNSSSSNITGWIVYLSGGLGDTGKVVVDQLAQFKAFTADTLPEGMSKQGFSYRS